MNDTNLTVLTGRLTRDPEMRYTQTGTAVTGFSIASNYSYTSNGEKKESASFFECEAWGKLAEIVSQYSAKGNLVLIEGRLKQESWEKDGQKHSKIKVVVDSFRNLTSKPKEGEPPF